MKCWIRILAHVCAAAAALLLPTLAHAQQVGPPLPERVRTLDESLQQEYGELILQATAGAPDGGRLAAALKAQQSTWLQHRDAACALAGMLSGAGGSAASTRTLQCKAEWTEAQRLRLWAAQDCLKQVSPSERAAEHERCLQALASPLRAGTAPP